LALAAIEKYRVTHCQCVPTMFIRLLKLPAADKERFDLSSMKYAVHGAAPCPVAVKKKMIDWWGPIIHEYYSATEGMGQTHVTTEEWLLKPGTVGKAFIGVIHVCDEQGKELPAGESGLIYFEAPKMPFRYHGDKEKTKSSQHPEYDNWSAPGDIGYVDEDGYLFLNDRASFMIISGGVNIYPREIEEAMLLHPKVADVAVIGVPNEEMGEEVKAFVQLENPAEESESLASELIAHTKEHIAHYKSPKSIDFMAALPRLPMGKLYKNPLKEKYWKQHATGII
jgi:long-chain acyl-CoA synthetase